VQAATGDGKLVSLLHKEVPGFLHGSESGYCEDSIKVFLQTMN
jgi:hypothetical protein